MPSPTDHPLLHDLNTAIEHYRELVSLEEADTTPATLTDVAAVQLARAQLAVAVERFALESQERLAVAPGQEGWAGDL